MSVQRNKTEDDITAEVLQRFAQTPEPRLRQIMSGLVKRDTCAQLDGRPETAP